MNVNSKISSFTCRLTEDTTTAQSCHAVASSHSSTDQQMVGLKSEAHGWSLSEAHPGTAEDLCSHTQLAHLADYLG